MFDDIKNCTLNENRHSVGFCHNNSRFMGSECIGDMPTFYVDDFKNSLSLRIPAT